MKILHVAGVYEPFFHTGGVARSVSQLCRNLAGAGVDVSVFTTNSDGTRKMDVTTNMPLEMGGVNVTYFKAIGPPRLRYAPSLRKACQEEITQFDLVHLTAFWVYPGLVAGREARRSDIPYVMSTRGSLMKTVMRRSGYLKKMAYLWLLERRNLQHAAAIHFTAIKEQRETTIFDCQKKGFVVPNMVDVGEFACTPSKVEARRQLDISQEATIINYLGRLHKRKGIDLLIRGFADFHQKCPNSLLFIAGPDDGFESHLRELADELGMGKCIRFTGYLGMEEKKALLAASDLSALVSHPGDNFGQSAVESLAIGTPVILSEHVCIAEGLRNDGVAIVVPTDAQAIGQALIRAFGDNELAAMARRSQSVARKRYAPESVTQQMIRAYEKILGG